MWTYLCHIWKKRRNVQEEPKHGTGNDRKSMDFCNPQHHRTNPVAERDVIREEKEELGGRLTRKQLYRDFKPLIIDTDTPDQVFGADDDVDQNFATVESGVEFLEICTNRPEYFVSFTVWLEMEYGLMTRTFSTGCDAGEPCKRGT